MTMGVSRACYLGSVEVVSLPPTHVIAFCLPQGLPGSAAVPAVFCSLAYEPSLEIHIARTILLPSVLLYRSTSFKAKGPR